MNTRYSDKRSLPARILSIIGKVLILGITSLFTAFPFIWMVLSMLKTKEEVMNPNSFIPLVPQWSNVTKVLFDSKVYVEFNLGISCDRCDSNNFWSHACICTCVLEI